MMARAPLPMLIAVVFAMLLTIPPAFCEDLSPAAASPGPVTEAMLKAKIAEVEAATGIVEQAKTKLVELYRKALSNLQTVSANSRSGEEFRQAAEVAPVRLQALREGMKQADSAPPEATLDVDPSTPLRQIVPRLQKEKPISPRRTPSVPISRSAMTRPSRSACSAWATGRKRSDWAIWTTI